MYERCICIPGIPKRPREQEEEILLFEVQECASSAYYKCFGRREMKHRNEKTGSTNRFLRQTLLE